MSLARLLLSPYGRIGRGPYIVSVFSLLVLAAAMARFYRSTPQNMIDGATIPISIIGLFAVYAAAMVTVKRLHDLDLSGWWALIYTWPAFTMAVLPKLLLVLPIMLLMDYTKPGFWVMLIATVVFATLLGYLMFTSGTQGPNRFGPPMAE